MTMQGLFLRASLVGATAVLLTSPSWAVTIDISTLLTNPSFETGSLTPWVSGGNQGTGVYAPTSAQYTAGADGLASGIVPNGSFAAFSPIGVTGAGTLTQNLSATYQANTDYSFTFWVGVPKTQPNGTTANSAWSTANNTLRVYFLEGTTSSNQTQDGLTAFDLTAAQIPALGQWLKVSVTETAAQIASASAVGRFIGIQLFVNASVQNNEVNFDIGEPGSPSSRAPAFRHRPRRDGSAWLAQETKSSGYRRLLN